MTLTWELILTAGGQILMAGVVWGAIRADIRNLKRNDDRQEIAIARAHERIDEVLRIAPKGAR